MAQHDYNIANAPGATVRADINALAEALAGMNSGASAPSVTFAFMLWADTTNDIIKVRNEANSGWISLFDVGASTLKYIGAAIAVANGGTGSTTAYGASDALNATGYVDVASGGTTNIGAAASQKVRITGTTTITAFDTVSAGIERDVYFNGDLTLTYNATSMQLPGAVSYAIKAGDRAKFVSLGSGNWRMVFYTPNLSPQLGYKYIGRQVFTASGTYTPTAGARFVRVRMLGAGGGGGAARAQSGGEAAAAAAGGGAAGQEILFDSLLSAFTSTVAITIGAAGAAGASPGGDGGTGGDTTFAAYATAKGGLGGGGIDTSEYDAEDGGTGVGTGTGPSGYISIPGQDGAPGMVGDGGAGADLIEATSGGGGKSSMSGGGRGRTVETTGAAGGSATGYGGGGGGAASKSNTGSNGGAGSAGIVIIEEFA